MIGTGSIGKMKNICALEMKWNEIKNIEGGNQNTCMPIISIK